MNVLLISTYEMGRQPFGLASPAAWLRRAGAKVSCLDLSRQRLDEEAVRDAEVVAFYLAMHTATRIALKAAEKVRALKPGAHLCAYGLYAPMNEELLRKMGFKTIIGGEFEAGLVSLVRSHEGGAGLPGPPTKAVVSLARQQFLVPDRAGLPDLAGYAQLSLPDGSRRVVGYTEASRGCKHLCRHCPIVPVYNGRFRIVQRDIVLEDIRQQVACGAKHITFGDPDFFNGIKHAVELVRCLRAQNPRLTYDVTIKVEHLLKYATLLSTLRETGCSFVTTAVESVDDRVLEILDKGHTRADFVKVVGVCRRAGLNLVPTFVAFNPWITLDGYRDLLKTLGELDLVDHVSPIQLAIRLLIPQGSRLLELPEVRQVVGGFDETALCYPWEHPDPRVDALQREVEAWVQGAATRADRRSVFREVWRRLHRALDRPLAPPPDRESALPRATIPFLNEPWYC
jgi:radical SAM superfamily enzyme YgiQ (UPF0313 family)